MIINLENPQTSEYLMFKKIVFSPNFEWHNVGSTGPYNKEQTDFNLFVHTFLGRPIESNPYPKVLSKHVDLATQITNQILTYNGIIPKTIYRMAVNYVTDVQGVNPLHIDHTFPHHNLLIYLNEFVGGRTIVMDNNTKIYSNPEEDLPIVFDGKLLHCHEASSSGKRIVFVSTFLK